MKRVVVVECWRLHHCPPCRSNTLLQQSQDCPRFVLSIREPVEIYISLVVHGIYSDQSLPLWRSHLSDHRRWQYSYQEPPCLFPVDEDGKEIISRLRQRHESSPFERDVSAAEIFLGGIPLAINLDDPSSNLKLIDSQRKSQLLVPNTASRHYGVPHIQPAHI